MILKKDKDMVELWKTSYESSGQKIVEKYDSQKRIVERQVYEDKNGDGYFSDTELVSHSIFGYREDGKRIEQERKDTDDNGYFDTNIFRRAELKNGKYTVGYENVNDHQEDDLKVHVEKLNSPRSSLKTKKQALEEIKKFDIRVAANLSDEEIMKLSSEVANIDLAM